MPTLPTIYVEDIDEKSLSVSHYIGYQYKTVEIIDNASIVW